MDCGTCFYKHKRFADTPCCDCEPGNEKYLSNNCTPELLEALKAAKIQIDLLKAFISDMGWDAGNNKRYEMICEAIAKAEGK